MYLAFEGYTNISDGGSLLLLRYLVLLSLNTLQQTDLFISQVMAVCVGGSSSTGIGVSVLLMYTV